MPDWERKYMGRWKMPNDDYILRSDALFELHRYASAKDPALMIAYRVDLCERIEKIPAAAVEPVRHGRWIPHETDDGFSNGVQCTVCGEWFYKYFTYNYCPDCGAKMDDELPKGEDDDNKNL